MSGNMNARNGEVVNSAFASADGRSFPAMSLTVPTPLAVAPLTAKISHMKPVPAMVFPVGPMPHCGIRSRSALAFRDPPRPDEGLVIEGELGESASTMGFPEPGTGPPGLHGGQCGIDGMNLCRGAASGYLGSRRRNPAPSGNGEIRCNWEKPSAPWRRP